uniref:Uncharacterized protein n=1 Tax=Acrobeloides nanus TaxID=290746 RepID=A0A914E8S6_9BILA
MKLLSIIVLLVIVAIALAQTDSTKAPKHHGLGGAHKNGTHKGGHGGRGQKKHGHKKHGSTAVPVVVAAGTR